MDGSHAPDRGVNRAEDIPEERSNRTPAYTKQAVVKTEAQYHPKQSDKTEPKHAM